MDPQLWHACAGSMVRIPPLNTNVFYFPQGHADHADANLDLGCFGRFPCMILCRVTAICYMAERGSDEVFAKLSLLPQNTADGGLSDKIEDESKSCATFAKTLTQSDANNGGGFSVPRYCAETIFPRLDYTADPPVQTILAKDVHGVTWKFRHIYRGTPRRHLLTTGWSNFVSQKRLVAGDSIVFLRAENDELCVGVRRAKRGQFGWNPAGGNSELVRIGDEGKVKAEDVLEAVSLAAAGKPFEIVYYPRASTPEFCVRASVVSEAMRIRWCPGMRFKMPFETEDSSRISWFMGTVSAAQVVDPVRWPDSPWRLLQVAWDEPDLLQNVKRVSPWLVEVVSNMPAVHLASFSPPRKKLKFPLHQNFLSVGQEFTPFPPPQSAGARANRPVPAGIQGARHGHFGLLSSDLHFIKMQAGVKFQRPSSRMSSSSEYLASKCEEESCLLTMGRNIHENISDARAPVFVLFGNPILIEEQGSQSSLGDAIRYSSSDVNVSDATESNTGQNQLMENSSDGGSPWHKDHSMTELKLGSLSSYNDFNSKLSHILGTGETLEMLRTRLAGTHHDLSL